MLFGFGTGEGGGGRPSARRRFSATVTATGRERTFGVDEVIVSKTDTAGVITYANDVFLRIAGMTEREAIGQPHSIIRHPDMPRAVFKLLWDTIGRGDEIFAYVLNMASNGDHYWVFAHITPTFGADGGIVGYHSNRRFPDAGAIAAVTPLYAKLKGIEDSAADRAAGLAASTAALAATLRDLGIGYDEFVFSLTR